MFTIRDPRPARTCAGPTRREFLRVGGLALAGVSLPQLLAARAAAAGQGGYVRPKSVVLLFLQGGPSHIEFFDPKMTAPVEVRSITGETATKLPGVTFGGTFTQLAEIADKLTIVRSYQSRNADHSYLSVTGGGNPMKAAMSAVYARVAGTNHPENGMPRNVLVLPEAVRDGLKLGSNFETGALPTLTDPGPLGTSYRAFDPSGGGPLRENLELRIEAERLGDRRALLTQLDSLRRRADAGGLEGADRFQQQAFDAISGGIARAFDLAQEDPATVARYDTSHIFRNEEIQRWGDMRRSTNLLGRQMLLARRLCEAGCGFVTVSDCGWDMHANGNSPKQMTAMWPMTKQVDHAVAAFVQDLHDRGLENDILLVVTGEMGRTPRLNGDGGRDHFGNLTSLLLAGGGLPMGQVIGQSNRDASAPATTPFGPEHLLATIFHTLFDVGRMRLDRTLPADILRLTERAEPIAGLG